MDDLWATKSEGVGLMLVQSVSNITNLCGHDPPTSRTDGRTDGQTTCDRNTALCTKVRRAVINLGEQSLLAKKPTLQPMIP